MAWQKRIPSQFGKQYSPGAQKHIEAETVDLILSDLRLPDRDGIDLLKWLGEHSLHIPLIIMTAMPTYSLPCKP